MILVVLDEGSLARTHTDTHAHAPTRTTTHSLFIVGMMLHVRLNQPHSSLGCGLLAASARTTSSPKRSFVEFGQMISHKHLIGLKPTILGQHQTCCCCIVVAICTRAPSCNNAHACESSSF